MSHLEVIFQSYAKEHGHTFTEEHKFHPTRKWRFDFADVEHKIAIEIEGGIWISGRHNRGSGFRADCEKYNQATVLGWRVLRYCSVDDIAKFFLDDYKQLLNGTTN